MANKMVTNGYNGKSIQLTSILMSSMPIIILMEPLALYYISNIHYGYNTCKTNDQYTVKPVYSGHSKIDKAKVLKTNCGLMKVDSIAAECSLGAFCNTVTCIKR